jgi:hypothetical protein
MIDFYDKENFAMLPDLKWLENPEIFRVNRLDAHCGGSLDPVCSS